MGASLLAVACAPSAAPIRHPELIQTVQLVSLNDSVLAWHIPKGVPMLRGAQLLVDAPRPAPTAVAVAKAIVRSNHRLGALDALRLAIIAQLCARAVGLNENFFSATILQESAFDPFAVSSAGALGIAQFTIDTADAFGIEPLDPQAALAGSARLLAGYLARYRSHRYGDPYALALAAYNAGPLAVDHYHGVPPYPETRGYIDDIDDRLARIVKDERR